MKKTKLEMRVASLVVLGVLGTLAAVGGGCSVGSEETTYEGEGPAEEEVATSESALSAISRDQIIAIAKSGVGYSYWWNHGRWRTDGTQPGSCSGSGCPGDCVHSGSYGADCSGFVAKAWQVSSPSSVDVDLHPYSTFNFRYETTHWDPISRNALVKGDALVYRSGDKGHIVIYESTAVSGAYSVYECRGCAYGCVHNTRSFGAEYIAIRRRLIEQPAGVDGCTDTQRNNCGAFGCSCVNGACNGGYCDGSGCTAQKTSDCGQFGCACVDGGCSGGYCDGSGCTAKAITDCGNFGCGCVDGQCSGGYCQGNGCTAKAITACSNFGCGCSLGKCSGGYCPQ